MKQNFVDIIFCLFFLFFRSRAHTIVSIKFVQKGKNDTGQNMTKTSIINLVDLAGRWDSCCFSLISFKTMTRTAFWTYDPRIDMLATELLSPNVAAVPTFVNIFAWWYQSEAIRHVTRDHTQLKIQPGKRQYRDHLKRMQLFISNFK